ncbi:MAG: hypothetical protein ACOVMQ_02350 [Cyclobacteriaceae bacterium]|jgi:uncharacterized lipoprotein YajG
MSNSQLQLELHQFIDQVKDTEVLNAIHTLLKSQVNVIARGADGKGLTKYDVDKMLQDSEEDISAGRLIKHQDLKEEISNWRKK